MIQCWSICYPFDQYISMYARVINLGIFSSNKKVWQFWLKERKEHQCSNSDVKMVSSPTTIQKCVLLGITEGLLPIS